MSFIKRHVLCNKTLLSAAALTLFTACNSSSSDGDVDNGDGSGGSPDGGGTVVTPV